MALALVVALAGGAAGEEGGRIAALTLEDQHGASGRVDETVRVLLLTRDMDGGKVLRAALGSADQRFLDERQAVYVADISGMPALVSRLFAVPGMRKRAYRILLDRDGVATRDVAHRSGTVTMLRLDGLRVTSAAHFADAEALRAALDAPAP